MSPEWLEKTQNLDWQQKRQFLQWSRFRPMYDRAFSRLLKNLAGENYLLDLNGLRTQFLNEFDRWLKGSQLNKVTGFDQFPHRDVIIGVTHFLDDLHITYGPRLVIIEHEYAYHRRMKPEITQRTLETLSKGDVLILAAPFSWYGDLHPQTQEILDRCLELEIPVHIDGAWFGCMRDFHFDYSHPAIQSAAFSLSKGLGMGSHRVGVRYARHRHAGPVTIINDFNMNIASLMWYGIHFIQEFGSDYIQNKYRDAYQTICREMNLRPTKAIHVALAESETGEWLPVGIRPFLRFLVDEVDEFEKMPG